MLRKGAWLAICLALAACSTFQNYEKPDAPRYAGAYASRPPSFHGTIKVVSYNIKFGIKVDPRQKTLEEIAAEEG